jgi:hypothetical protein
MSKHDLLLIFAGAVLGLVVSGVGKWLFGIFDAVVPVSKAPDKVRATFSSKANRSLLKSTLFLLWMIGATVFFAFDKSPVTRLSILNGAMLSCGLAVGVASLMWDIASFTRNRTKEKAEDGGSLSVR